LGHVCDVVKTRSRDANTQVGCVIIDEFHRIISTGYNSFPTGIYDKAWPNERSQIQYIYNCSTNNGSESIIFADKPIETDEFLPKAELLGEFTKYDVTTHAEANAIASAGRSLRGATLYCNLVPCNHCAMLIINAGIKKVIAQKRHIGWSTAHIIAEKLMQEAGLEIIIVEDEKK